ncbi:MAG TPA: 50S ribosomal protein L6 [Candidatus Saccharimonadales bacterium]|nr:50S ribosomal protein L6 [Candidatus Saccharimonadales bacterium]
MSRVGKKILPLPKGVTVTAEGGQVRVKGPKGELSRPILPDTSVVVSGAEVRVELAASAAKGADARHGTMRANLANMVHGVTEGFSRSLEINGVGYRAAMEGKRRLVLQLGYSHPIAYDLPEGVEATVEGQNKILLRSINKELLGQAAANVRAFRPPEPYKGKGIKYEGEHIIRKAGKTAGST